ncbi:HEAT repeat domain-containing protein [Candidatus Binatus sp.]|uniref:HEAT repeat domain-containing protein n=1 Tax=Candidatus Binatus sp. TaxID=2811406 RepID=UPI002F94CBB7
MASNPPSDDAVLAFLHEITDGGELFQLGICSSQFADLRHSGNLSLVVSYSDGRNCQLSVIDKTPSGFESYAAPARPGSWEVRDLAGNGQFQLVVATEFTSYLGAMHCVAIWPVIYAWTGKGYTDVSSQYTSYYEQELAALKEQIAAHSEEAQAPAASQTPGSVAHRIPVLITRMSTTESSPASSNGVGAAQVVPAPPPSPSPAASPAVTLTGSLDCAKAEAAKIERFLGIDKDAGMADAIKWADSDNPYQREFAASVLGDIGTPDAVEQLRTLSRDPNRVVAAGANVYLGFAGRGPRLNMIEREEAEPPPAGSPPK